MPGLRFQVLDAGHQPLDGGVVVVCPGLDDCLEVSLDDEGWLTIPSEFVLHHRTLTFVVYGPRGEPRFARSDWSASSAQRRVVAADPEQARCRLLGDDDHGLQIEIRPPAAAAPVKPTLTLPPGSSGEQAASPWRLALGAGWLVGGHFTGDSEALGGVDSVAPGPWASVLRRQGPWRLGVGYAMNRYRVTRYDDAGAGDLSFHRLTAEAGLVSESGPWALGVAGAVSYGGVFDGTSRLELDGRSYSMLGLGFRAELTYEFWDLGDRRLGALLQVDAIHYLADETEHDHWYGTAPALGLGAVLR